MDVFYAYINKLAIIMIQFRNFLILIMFFTFNELISQEIIGMKEVYIDNNLVYKNLDTKLKADKVELDLITKNSKIFMFDNSTVKIIKD